MAKILLVDDDALLVRMYKKKFENDGYTVDVANDGGVALEKVKTFNPDLMLLDIMMPKVTGYEVLEKLKEDPNTATLPVVLLTNVSSSDDDLERGMELGAISYIVKAGNRPSVVVSKIKEILGDL